MGNSGSVHNLTALDDHHRFNGPAHHQHQLQYVQHHGHPNLDQYPPSASAQWSQSIPRGGAHHTRSGDNASPPPPTVAAVRPIKVLPTHSGVGARLRATNNGDILHGGGTLTGRRESGPGYRALRPHTDHHPVPPQPMRAAAARPPMMQRSQTQLNLVQDRTPPLRRPTPLAAFQQLQHAQSDGATFKRFDSEPDLRGIDQPTVPTASHHSSRPLPQAPTTANNRMAAVRKKLAPPPPTHQNANRSGQSQYDPSRFGWKPPAPKPPPLNEPTTTAPRKLRLFKTKAESRTKATPKPEPSPEPSPFVSLPHHHHPGKTLPAPAPTPAPANLLPQPGLAPKFRREKSFDVGLLRLHHGRTATSSDEDNETTTSPSPPPPPPAQRTDDRSAAATEFQRELLEVTRRRSSGNHATPEPAAVPATFLPPIPRVRHLPGRPDDQAQPIPSQTLPRPHQVTSSVATSVQSAAPPPPPPPPPPTNLVYQSPATKVAKEVLTTPQRDPDPEPHPPASATKTFYFGMDADSTPVDHRSATLHPSTTPDEIHLIDEYLTNKIQMDVIDRFAESLMQKQNRRRRRLQQPHHLRNNNINPSSMGSSSSMDSDENDDDDDLGGPVDPPARRHDADEELDDEESVTSIQVHMRPTLPRRQFEIPRFSPAAAWRTLATGDETNGTTATGQSKGTAHHNPFSSYAADGSVVSADEECVRASAHQPLERRIERIYREPQMMGVGVAGAFAADTKSGDSGISGDAGPLRADSPTAVTASGQPGVGPFLAAWTPLQDLGDEDDDDEEDGEGDGGGEFGRHGHTFSLSLPRDAKSEMTGVHVSGFKSLQKVAGHRSTADDAADTIDNGPEMKTAATVNAQDATNSYRLGDSNWLLSRSAPNSIELFDDTPKAEADPSALNSAARRPRQQQPPSFGYLTGGQHVMYLPHHTPSPPAPPPPPEDEEATRKYSTDSVETTPPVATTEATEQPSRKGRHHSSHHRFTFQSTVRQIERRRLAERLSRDAEQMEAQRLTESEAMRLVEEEFQQKRASEKASIRQQLRLFTKMHGGGGTKAQGGESGAAIEKETGHVPTSGYRGHRSLPYEWQTPRAEPDGAVASPNGSPRSPVKFPPARRHNDENSSTVSTSSSSSSIDNDQVHPGGGGHLNDEYNDHSSNSSDAYARMDTKTPYIMRLIEAKSGHHGRQLPRAPPSTEILSEFRSTTNARREYVDYRGANAAPATKHHPPTVGHIHGGGGGTRAQQAHYGNHHHHHHHHHGATDDSMPSPDQNYRKDFAHGRSVCSSDSDLSGPTHTGPGAVSSAASGAQLASARHHRSDPINNGTSRNVLSSSALPARAR